ncbi:MULTISPECIES: 3-hydroxyisobutyrate dehydrogenase [Paraburkholderia]|uniref:3-hydroxyisobutyrate dehydrogenase n=1 Tax=Paraburkholderia madseniana TaxID=2599607 RepID=A0AAP5ESC2_9BURK|nr:MULTISPECIES: 3-hydroxyisobutyrate dehydrogenase [Paraburkholderia]MCX4149971.1 3-hydroxyisobutyrate dehydrogenase [Paraburkholderia madseniana]MDN7152907.1 3-hydroxyisobutyrate dehydrogenase [Paraburkholderia sp. WS6]MDQ6411789.1 3-hydroxyisobutyrate dehydrogenase [Paraburkholderia madseniana]
MKNTHIAFFGLGHMGAPMALNLQSAGYTVRSFDLSVEACQIAREKGLTVSASAQEAVAGAHMVFSMLPASRHVEALYLGNQGILEQLPQGSLVVDCSTIAPMSAQKVAQAAQLRGMHMIDAPVSGGTAGASAGTLTFMVGGTPEALELVQPALHAMGRYIFHIGASGAGQVAKLCNNMALAVIMGVTAEAISLGVAHGLDPKVLSEMMAVSTGRSWATEVCNPWPGVLDNAPASRGYTGGFGNDLMLKDLGLAAEAAISVGATIPLGELARNLYALNKNVGRGGLDFSSVIMLLGQDAC